MAKASATHYVNIVDDPRWAMTVSRDTRADGQFFYSVKTTGVYCRPSCGARTPKPENVRFHGTITEAEQAGFRPCKRCRPNQPPLPEQHAALVTALCRLIEQTETEPNLAILAQKAQMSASHLHRIFKAVTGVTPKAYASAHRANRVRVELQPNNSITKAIYEAGYGSSTRFYETARGCLGMTPKDYRAGGAHTKIRFAVGECSLGTILVAVTERGVCAILMGDDPHILVRDFQDRFPCAELLGGDPDFEQQVAKVIGFVEAPKIGLNLPLDIRGTAFQQRVWQALRDIPVGRTASYAEIAQKIGAPRSVRAVARACAANTLAVAIPCHRVVRSDGGLSGYRWGVERKRSLLKREAQ